jgi:hypothetical protein
MSVDWRSMKERLTDFRRLDVGLQQQLTDLYKAQADDEKLAFKLEEGRMYGLRQVYYNTKLARELTRTLASKSITEDHW